MTGRADVGATYARLDDSGEIVSASWLDAGFSNKVRIVAEAGPIPGDILAMSSRTPVSAGRALQNALVHSPATSPLAAAARALFQCDGFEIPKREHLMPLGRLVDGVSEARRFSSAFPPARGPALTAESLDDHSVGKLGSSLVAWASADRNAERETPTHPSEARWGVICCASKMRKPARWRRSASSENATFEASVSR